VLVSSGAIFYGMSLLGLKSRPSQLAQLQAAAALGQIELMDIYRKGFGVRGIKCAQILLTWDDFNQRQRYLNAKSTIRALLESGIIPVINENDTVSTEEIKFGDNDRLSALVANLIEANILIILSDVDGLINNEKKEIMRIIDEITPQIKKMASPTDKNTCVGGMITKLEAGQIAIDSGIYCLIANGKKKDILSLALSQSEVAGTLFLPKKDRLEARKRWIAFGTKPKGKIYVDDGAKEALSKNFRSLLSPGIVGLEGDFVAEDAVSVVDTKGRIFAQGICAYSVEELRKIKGKRAKKEVIHRNNLVILNKE
jgi:glutamate 5-kinase